MSKKSFASRPKPNRDPAALDALVQSGPVKDVKSVNTETQKGRKAETQKSEPTARLTVDMPKSLHQRFKAACVLEGTKMNDELRRYIERRVAEMEARR